MSLLFWWIIPAAAVLILAAAGYWLYLRKSGSDTRQVANVDRLTALPGYTQARRRRAQALGIMLSALLVVILGTVVAASRPAHTKADYPENANRDIMLCLDVSGSMTTSDAKVAEVYGQLAKDFKGERIGLTVFDSSAVQVFPLTDDYDFVTSALADAKAALTEPSKHPNYFSGTFSGRGSSLVGDGLMSCVNSFPQENPGDGAPAPSQRSRTIVLATDNNVTGPPLFPLTEAAQKATAEHITVDALNPQASAGDGAKNAAELQSAVKGTGGQYFSLGDSAAVSKIVAQIQSTGVSKVKGSPRISVVDDPGLWLMIAGIGVLGLLVGVWRWRW